MKTFIKVVITLGVLAVAVALGLLVWRDYLLYPWTRDGQADAYVVGIAARVSGPMIEVTVKDNQWVNRGDLLFEIDPTDYAQEVVAAQASLNRAKVKAENLSREVERRRQLVADKLISLEEFQDFETQYAEAVADIAVDEAQLELARLDLGYTKVYATVDGYVTNLQVAEGTYVTKGQPLVALIDFDSFWIYGFFKETDLRNIEPGDRAEVRFMGQHFEPLEGVVESVGWGIFREDGAEAQNLLPVVAPTVDWVRLAQRFPVRIKLIDPPHEALMRVGRTASVMVFPGEKPKGGAETLAVHSPASPYPMALTDGRGDETVIPVEPQRIVSLAPSATEILIKMGQGDRLVAVTEHCDVPENLGDLPRLSVYPSPPFEAVAALEPDLILLADITNAADVRRLRRLGMPALVLNSVGYDGVMDDVNLTGQALDQQQAAWDISAKMQATRDGVRKNLAAKPNWQAPRTVIFTDYEWQYAAGAGTFGDGLITEAGGVNIAAEAGSGWPQLSREFLLEADPEVILYSSPGGGNGTLIDGAALSDYRGDPIWSQLSAVKNGRVYFIDAKQFSVPGPRVAEALKQVANAIQAE